MLKSYKKCRHKGFKVAKKLYFKVEMGHNTGRESKNAFLITIPAICN